MDKLLFYSFSLGDVGLIVERTGIVFENNIFVPSDHY
jgi:hypothetical protein